MNAKTQTSSNGTAIAFADGADDSHNKTNPSLTRQVSVSEAAEKSGAIVQAPSIIRWIELPFRVPDPVQGIVLPEATGWGMNAAGRGPLNQVGSYVGSAIVRLAIKEVGPGGTVYGFKPSSLLTLSTSIIGVIAAILMPIVGAVVDHTRYRRGLGIVSGILSVAFIGGQIAIGQNNWFAILLIDSAQTLVYLVHTTSVFAYLPDLSLDQEVISHYTSRFNIRQYVGQFIFVSLVIICGEARGTDRTLESAVQTAKDAAGIAFGFGALFIGYSWIFLFRDRPALSQVPEGTNLFNTGFRQVFKTGSNIFRNYRALRWFMVSLLWSPEAGAGVILSIAITFLTVTVKLTNQEIAITSLLLMVGNLAGSVFSKKACTLINPLNSYRIAMLALGACIAFSMSYLNGPRKIVETYLTAIGWGAAMGWAYPSQRVLFCTLIPKGQETEMMGLFVFVGQILGWLPALIFTVMNEQGIEQHYGLGMVGAFCLAAVVCTLPMGSYQDACQQAINASQAKLHAVVEATAQNKVCAETGATDDLGSLEEEKRTNKASITMEEESAPTANYSREEAGREDCEGNRSA